MDSIKKHIVIIFHILKTDSGDANMKSQIIMSHNGYMMTNIYFGEISIGDEIASIEERMEFENGEAIKKIKVMVCDYTKANIKDFSAEDMLREIQLLCKAAKSNPNITLIGIAPRRFDFGLARMWQAYAEYNEPLPWKTHVVKTIEEANDIINGILNGRDE